MVEENEQKCGRKTYRPYLHDGPSLDQRRNFFPPFSVHFQPFDEQVVLFPCPPPRRPRVHFRFVEHVLPDVVVVPRPQRQVAVILHLLLRRGELMQRNFNILPHGWKRCHRQLPLTKSMSILLVFL